MTATATQIGVPDGVTTASSQRARELSRDGRCYVGERCRAGCRVIVADDAGVRALPTRTHDPLWSFSWGRAGASARELAWSILYDSAHDAALADDWCPDFTAEVIACLPWDAFSLTSRDVLDWLYENCPARALLERAAQRGGVAIALR